MIDSPENEKTIIFSPVSFPWCRHACVSYPLYPLTRPPNFPPHPPPQVRDHVLFVEAPIKRIDIGGTDDLVRVQLEPSPKQARLTPDGAGCPCSVELIILIGDGYMIDM